MTERLDQRVERFLRTGEGDFESLAMEVFAHQFEKNGPYRAFCKASGKFPAQVSRWEDIPAVPIGAFKSSELVTFPAAQAAAVFHSSGTTQRTPSRHFLRTLTYYETSLKWGFQRWVLPAQESLPFLILAPSPAEAPHSSLSWMLEVVKRQWGKTGSDYFVQRGLVQDWQLSRTLAEAEHRNQPMILLGTTLAFLTFFERCAQQKKSFRCPPGSRLMDTGGMKTQTRQVSREEFLHGVWSTLGIPEAECINEYGMCEMSSQFYARGASPVFQGPPWVRTRIVDGQVCHFDLANVDSVMAIQTEDVGVMTANGFILKGRVPSAELKGCSVDMEAYLQRS